MTAGHDERHTLLEELDLLRERRRDIEDALAVQDRPDESEDIQLRDELDWIDRKIRDLTHLLWAAAARSNAAPDRVGVGAVVTLRYPDGQVETAQVTAVPDEDVPSVTPESPLGRALLGAPVDEEISWDAPEGRLRARVERIELAGAPSRW
jgi:transcription elongation GreA/GreB family factor